MSKKPKVRYPGLLLALLIFAFVTRVWRLHLPEKYVFDEVYHALTAKLIARDDPRAFEWWNPPVEEDTAVDWLHPPLAKYTQAFAIKLFGETSFGWRLSSALFGVGVIYLTFILGRNVFHDEKIGLLGAFLASLDGLLLTQSRIAMNDIHVTFFIVLTLIFYHRYRKSYFDTNKKEFWPQKPWLLLATAGAAGLACGSKWSGAFMVALLLLCEGFFWLRSAFPVILQKKWQHFFELSIKGALTVIPLLLIPALLYVGSYALMFMQGKDLKHFQDLHYQIWYYQTHLEATHPFQSRPFQWFMDLRPVWYYVDYASETSMGNIYAFGNPIIFWTGAIAVILSISAVIGHSFNLKSSNLPESFSEPATYRRLALLLSAYAIVWLPWQLSPRIMFFYHYTPAVPFLCILLAWWLWQLWNSYKGRWVSAGVVSLAVITFIVWYPHWTGILMPKEFVESVYFAIKSWR